MFERQFVKKPVAQQSSEGCKMNIKYDKNGRVKEYTDNGKCSKQEREAIIKNLSTAGQKIDVED